MYSAVTKQCYVTIVTVELVQTPDQLVMQEVWMQSHHVTAKDVVFHSTTRAKSKKIVELGFEERLTLNTVWGKGIYTGKDIVVTTLYGEPEKTGKGLVQCVIIAHLAKGTVAVGNHNQMDFGTTADGTPVTTLTNIMQALVMELCSKYDVPDVQKVWAVRFCGLAVIHEGNLAAKLHKQCLHNGPSILSDCVKSVLDFNFDTVTILFYDSR